MLHKYTQIFITMRIEFIFPKPMNEIKSKKENENGTFVFDRMGPIGLNYTT